MSIGTVKSATPAIERPASRISRALGLLQSRVFVAFIGLILLSLLLSILSPYFLTTTNILNVLRQVSIIAIIAVGMTYVIITGGIDLSVGSVLAVSSVIMAVLMKAGVNPYLAMGVALVVGAICGGISGILVTSRIKMPPFIATLAMMSIARGASLVITGGIPIYGLTGGFQFLGMGYWLGIPVPVIIMFIVFLLGHLDLSFTRHGIYYFAVGGNEEAARLAGIDVSRAKLRAYILSGVTAAVAGIVLASRLTAVEPTSGLGYELDAIAAAVIGGVSLSGGEGSLIGTALGALIMGVLRNGLNLLNVSTYWQQVVIGLVIAVTVSLAITKKK